MGNTNPTPLAARNKAASSADSRADSGNELTLRDLQPLAEQLMLIAEQLRNPESDSGDDRSSGELRGSGPKRHRYVGRAAQKDAVRRREENRALYAEMAREVYAIRRQRSTIFGNPDLFGEPAWDILLDLYVAQAEDKKVSVSSACIGSASPPTTGLRWLGILADHDLVVREHDTADQRRVLVRLSDKGLEAMDTYFACAMGRS